MPSARLKNYLHLHFIVFIWGFTAVLGKLISIDAMPLVWYRMSVAVLLILLFVTLKRYSLKITSKIAKLLIVAGIALALHWVTFFLAIKISNVSIALAAMSTGAFFTAFLEPLVYRRRIVWYELAFGAIVIFGLYLIFQVDITYLNGILIALLSALLAAIFTLINGKLIQLQKPSVISFYELLIGVIFLSVFLGLKGDFSKNFFHLSWEDSVYLFILASVCTVYAYIASVKVMRYVTPYTMMLTVNMEPVYGILLALLIFGESEKMNPMFYVGALIILGTVIANGILKNRRALKSERG